MKVVICGAGIAGLALAHRVAGTGGEVVVLERATGPREQGYMIDFFGPGFDAAEKMGLLPAIQEAGYRVDEVCFVDQRGRRRAEVPYGLLRKALGGRLISLMRPDLERVLRESLPATVDLRYSTTVCSISDGPDEVVVTLDDGSLLAADVLVGADGLHSTVREQVFGPESMFVRYLGFHTAAYVFDSPEVRDAVAGRFALTDTKNKQLGLYTLRDGRVALFGVHPSSDPRLPDDTRAAVRKAYRGLGWVVPEALEKCPPPHELYYDQVAQIEMPRWSTGRVTLLGDSCCAVSLIAGQGASLAVAGAFVLADKLNTAPSVPAALADYERMWRAQVAEKQKAARDAVRWYMPRSTAAIWLRRVALRLAWLPVVNRLVGRTLAGKAASLTTESVHGTMTSALGR
ncbi:2-polyprenyl-6-methoxyphenol hydroxylase-like oxidoreductase [Mycolicibacterium chubuense NBB4]|uniref:2-polyprenyl-6-methoxyphenol hydroxylase-like oxidoreductase n=1 Tax=Mycolicibacterium chubuense (strain NBB4) TaxID=710421 RepID=I4BNK7_MYCCN|nr:FAD-dependent monooxygenase [Mycolicibacterium chubuense]AFM18864.1 2-polyprenyl-6-methoxyphenol hydroxylase-like oxidoreductase [Mycolicibacterium chubuense NBB4]